MPPKRGLVRAVSAGGALRSPTLRTRGANELLVAFVSASGPASGAQRVKQISGDSLHWSLVTRQAVPGGDAEIWQARASHAATGQVAVQLAVPGDPATMAIESYGGTAYVKAHDSDHGAGSAPTLALRGVGGALVVGVGSSSGQKGGVAPLAGQRLLAQYAGSGGAAGWVQLGSSSGSVGDSHPAAHWGMAAVAIAARSGPGASASATGGATTRAGEPEPDPAPAARPADIALQSEGSAAPDVRSRAIARGAGGASRSYTYNARGDRTGESTAGTTLALRYDQANRLVGVGGEISYAYNGDGLRTSKTVAGATTAFAWGEIEKMPELLQSGGTSYVYGPEGLPIEQITAGTPLFLHQDQQGSTRLLTDAGGNAVGHYDYDPWGNVARHTGSGTTELQFDGQYTDAETGYQYLRARYYDPATGQFLTVDPAVAATGSRYGFTFNDPLNLTDPLGLFGWAHAFKIAGLVVGGVAVAAAGCAFTLCTADAAALAAAGTVGTVATVASVSIDTGLAVNDCIGHGDRNDCVSSSVGAGIGVVTAGSAKIAEYSFKGVGRAVDFYGSALSFSYDKGTYQGGPVRNGAASWAGGGGTDPCTPAPITIQGSSSTSLQPAAGAGSLQ